MNASEKSVRNFGIIINANDILQHKVKRKHLLENIIGEGEKKRNELYIYRIFHLYDTKDDRKEREHNIAL